MIQRDEYQVVLGSRDVEVFDLAVQGHPRKVYLIELLVEGDFLVESDVSEDLVQLRIHLLHNCLDFGGKILAFTLDVQLLLELDQVQQVRYIGTLAL